MYLYGHTAGQLVADPGNGRFDLEQPGLGPGHGAHLCDGAAKGLITPLYSNSISYLQLILHFFSYLKGHRHGILIGNYKSNVTGCRHGILFHGNRLYLAGNGCRHGVKIQLIPGGFHPNARLCKLCCIGGIRLGIHLILRDVVGLLRSFQVVF